MKAWMGLWLACALLAPAGAARADSLEDARRQAESSMLVRGTVDIAPDGSVAAHAIESPEQLPSGVRDLVASSVPGWRFEPVQHAGQPVKARVGMSVRVVARQVGEGQYEIGIRNASFGPAGGGQADSGLRLDSARRPDFPRAAAAAGVTGTAYLLLRIAADGTVDDVVAEQVNLRVIGTPGQMERSRKLFADAAKATARKWTFAVSPGRDAGADGFSHVRIPVAFLLPDRPEPGYGKWDTYVPGPVQRASWQKTPERPGFSPDAMVAGQPQAVGDAPTLLTPLEEG